MKDEGGCGPAWVCTVQIHAGPASFPYAWGQASERVARHSGGMQWCNTDFLPKSGGQHVGSWSARRRRRVGMREAGLTCDWRWLHEPAGFQRQRCRSHPRQRSCPHD